MKYRHAEWDGARPPANGSDENITQRYELIIGSDVLYDRDGSAALAAFIGRHGTATGEVWIVDPERGNRPAFTRHLQGLGYELAAQSRLNHPAAGEGAPYHGRFLRFSRGQNSAPGSGPDFPG